MTQHTPNHIPWAERLVNALYALALLLYGAYGLWIDDLYLPGKKGPGMHLHGLPAWVMYGAFISACLMLLSVWVDHYDKRNNEVVYQRFRKLSGWAAVMFGIVSVAMDITGYDGSSSRLVHFLLLVLVLGAAAALGARWVARLHMQHAKEQAAQECYKQEAADFAHIKWPAVEERFALHAATAQVIWHEKKYQTDDAGVARVQITRIVRNPAGEYFYWLWQDAKGSSLEPIAQMKARVLLGPDYISPPEA